MMGHFSPGTREIIKWWNIFQVLKNPIIYLEFYVQRKIFTNEGEIKIFSEKWKWRPFAVDWYIKKFWRKFFWLKGNDTGWELSIIAWGFIIYVDVKVLHFYIYYQCCRDFKGSEIREAYSYKDERVINGNFMVLLVFRVF